MEARERKTKASLLGIWKKCEEAAAEGGSRIKILASELNGFMIEELKKENLSVDFLEEG